MPIMSWERSNLFWMRCGRWAISTMIRETWLELLRKERIGCRLASDHDRRSSQPHSNYFLSSEGVGSTQSLLFCR
jgi:hypothetical protein